MTTYVNVLTHPVDLADGRVIPAGGVCEPGREAHDKQLVEAGTLVKVAEPKKPNRGGK